MMNIMKKTLIASLLGTTALFACAAAANAAVLTSSDQKFTMETPNDEWKEISDETTKMTLTNGTDFVTVTCYDKQEVLMDLEHILPMPTVSHDEYAEEVLTYYSTEKDVYVITGLAEKEEGITDVRFIVNSIQLADHAKASVSEKKEEKKEDTEAKKTDEMYTLYNELGQQIIVYLYTDGNYRSENGTLFQHADDNEWVDYYGNHYTTNGTSVSAEKTGVSFEVVSEAGNTVIVYEYSDGSLRSDDNNLFQATDGNEYIDYYGNHYVVAGAAAGDDADVEEDAENIAEEDSVEE